MGKLALTGNSGTRTRLADLPAGGFTPATPSNLWAWWDASDTATITATGGDVSQWNDKSGNGLHLVPGTSPKTGTRTLNSKNVLDFNGTTHNLAKTSISLGVTAFTVFVVCGGDTDHSDERRIISLNLSPSSGWNTANGFIIADGNTSNRIEFISNFATNGILQLAGAFATPTDYYTVRKQGTGTNQTAIWRGNNAATATQTNASTGTGTSIHIGTGHNSGETSDGLNFDGIIAEIIIYSAALSDADRDAVWTYLAAKWAL